MSVNFLLSLFYRFFILILFQEKQKKCIQLLVKGYVHSFTEFFALINYKKPIDPVLALQSPPELSHDQYDLVANFLAEAEIAQRRNDLARASAAYLSLADDFAAKNDLTRAVAFYEKCYPLAAKVGNFEEQVIFVFTFVKHMIWFLIISIYLIIQMYFTIHFVFFCHNLEYSFASSIAQLRQEWPERPQKSCVVQHLT